MDINVVGIFLFLDDFEDLDVEQVVIINLLILLLEIQLIIIFRLVSLFFWFEVLEGKNVFYRFVNVLVGKFYFKNCLDFLTFSVLKNIVLYGIYIFNSY